MEITLEMLNNDYVTALLVAGDYCRLEICTEVKVFEPNFDTYEIITTFVIERFFKNSTKRSEFFRYQNLIDALQKFNEIEEG
jgi:hypothetical protein